jgi:hypothetical protein
MRAIHYCTISLLLWSFHSKGQNIPNNSFENWAVKNKTVNIPIVGNQTSVFSDPIGWSSSNVFTATNTFGNKSVVTKDSVQKMHLNASVKLKTDQFNLIIQNIKVPGILILANDVIVPFSGITGFNANNIPGAGMPFTGKPKSFYGYYKDSIIGGDSISCYAVLKNKSEVIATALFSTNANQPGFTRFEADFNYLSCKDPDSVYFVFATSKINNLFSTSINVGTTLWVDSIGINSPSGFVPNIPINARNDSAVIKCNNPINISVLANDDTCLQTGLTLSITQQSSEGLATVNGNNIVFTKNAIAKNGFTSIRYKICNAAVQCDSAQVFINIIPRFDAVNDRDTVRCEVFKDIDVKINDIICTGLQDTLRIVTQSNKGTATVINNKLRFTKTPTATAGNTTVKYVLCSNANTECDTATLTLVVLTTKIDAKDDTISTNCLDPIQLMILSNDVLACGGTFNNVTLVTQPAKGTASISPTNRLTFTPGLNSSGIIAFKYRVCEDITTLCDTAEIRINLRSGNKLMAIDDSAYTSSTAPINILIGTNDTFNACFNNKQITLITNPNFGNALLKGDTIVYTSASSFLNDYFTYTMCGTNGGNNFCDSATVKVGKPLGSAVEEIKSTIHLYPNPAADILYITGSKVLTDIKLTTIEGKQVETEATVMNATNYMLTMPSMPGVYLLQLKDALGNNSSHKIVRE